MIRSIARPARKAKVVRAAQGRAAAHVFRDFVRQLERLDARRPKSARQGAR
ncbi:hypothetical protein [Microvirga puerhi]|uniref:Uncharacterized protein n=1 Tax=Microvirga puerhi TaxID=2876078 RepID=A0ABS7VLI5_9HYPH|nr:hypothetical protein [Microvirga puerhi]MBZ6076401.1 hypothetical protein [Microvirga puerhi]